MKPYDDTQAVLTAEFGQQVARSTRLSDKVAEAMLETILRLGLRPGAPLPAERELAGQYGVSRTVIREAVRALMSRGVIDARAGRGLSVSQVAADAVSSSMQLYLHGRGEIPYAKIHEVRAGIETDIAVYAAERATQAEIAELEAITERMKAGDATLEEHSQMDVEFHRAVARMTHNELYLIMLDSIGPVLLEIRRATFALPDDRRKTYHAHKRILDAIAAHNPEGAREAMRLHLEEAKQEWLALGLVHVKAL